MVKVNVMDDFYDDSGVDPDFFLDSDFDNSDFDSSAHEAEFDLGYDLGDVPTDDISNLSWEELAVSLGFAEEMLGNEKPRRISIAEYMNESSRNQNRKRDRRPFETFVDNYIKTVSKLETGGNDPIETLLGKLEMTGLTYKELRKALVVSVTIANMNAIPEDPEMLNLLVCLDLITIANECVFLGSTDIVDVLLNHVDDIKSDQIRYVKQTLM